MSFLKSSGAGCEVCGLEAGQALQEEGLKEAALAQVLTHKGIAEPVVTYAVEGT